MLDEEAIIFKVQYLYGKHGRKCGRYKREGECALPGEVCLLGQKSADGIVSAKKRGGEGLNMKLG